MFQITIKTGIMKKLSIFCAILVAMLFATSCADSGKKKAPKRYGWDNEDINWHFFMGDNT